MAKYKSIPHTIDAYQFTNNIKEAPPEWMIKAHHNGTLQVTMSEKYGNYITIYNKNQMERARKGDWICRHENGKMFALDNDRFKKSFQKD